MSKIRIVCSVAALGFMLSLTGCGDSKPADDAPAGQTGKVAEQKEQANYAVGRVTFADGSPITGEVIDIKIGIQGVSEAGEKIYYNAIVKNGAYKQKLVAGQYSFSPAKIVMKHGETEFTLDLEPVGRNWNKNQDAADGIVQDFVWKPTGQAETYGAKPDPNNATHWHGMCFGMRFATYREDKKAGAEMPPEGSKLFFTLTPKSKGIDGSELKPITIEREWRPKDIFYNDDLNDIMPADWEITGVIKLPDGTTKNLVFQGTGDYPNFVKTGRGPLQYDNIIGGMAKQLMSWGVE